MMVVRLLLKLNNGKILIFSGEDLWRWQSMNPNGFQTNDLMNSVNGHC